MVLLVQIRLSTADGIPPRIPYWPQQNSGGNTTGSSEKSPFIEWVPDTCHIDMQFYRRKFYASTELNLKVLYAVVKF